nr:hypothetical protein Iba_chr10dCG14540 [Ipomoea batatas]
MNPKLCPRYHFQQLFHRSTVTWKCYKRICLPSHFSFTLMHIRNDFDIPNTFTRYLSMHQCFRNHPKNMTPSIIDFSGNQTHQTYTSTTIDQVYLPTNQFIPQLNSSITEDFSVA